MAKHIDTRAFATFDEITSRLDEIAREVRRKDLPLESSLDLFDEAVALASKAVDLVDTQAPTEQELAEAAAAEAAQSAQAPQAGGDADASATGA